MRSGGRRSPQNFPTAWFEIANAYSAPATTRSWFPTCRTWGKVLAQGVGEASGPDALVDHSVQVRRVPFGRGERALEDEVGGFHRSENHRLKQVQPGCERLAKPKVARNRFRSASSRKMGSRLPAIHHLVNRAFVFHPQRSRQGGKVTQSGCVNSED